MATAYGKIVHNGEEKEIFLRKIDVRCFVWFDRNRNEIEEIATAESATDAKINAWQSFKDSFEVVEKVDSFRYNGAALRDA